MPQNAFFPHEIAIFWSAKKRRKDTFLPPSIPFPCNFWNCNSGGICTASQLQVQLPLLYTAWSNAYSEIGPEVTLRPLATSQGYKGHSLVQSSFTQPPNTGYWCHCGNQSVTCYESHPQSSETERCTQLAKSKTINYVWEKKIDLTTTNMRVL